MSKNFEVLTQAVEDRQFFEVAARGVPPSTVHRPARKPGELAHQEVVKLAQRVFLLSGNGTAPRAVMFCGIEHGCGTSWICAQVARAVAAQGTKTICAVDANLRSPALHLQLRVPNRRGLADAVRRAGPIRDFLEPVPGGKLWVLPVGLDPGPGLLLASEHLRERVTELRAEFDYLIFDAPPVSLSGDAALLGRLLDGVVVVVGAHSTRRETAREAKESLDAAHVRLLGTVLNNRTFPIPEALYRRL
jgi:protein-tyrosine kinase